MRNLFPCAVLLLGLVSCSKPDQPEHTNTSHPNQATSASFTVDSVTVDEEIKINSKTRAAYASKILVFPGIKDKVLLDSIYSLAGMQLKTYTKASVLEALQKRKDTFFEEHKSMGKNHVPDYEQMLEEHADMNVFSRHNDLLILSYEVSGYGGGAHGYFHIFYKNFDLKNRKTVELEDIFKDAEKINWNQLLSRYFVDKDQKDMLLVEVLPVTPNFYLDPKKITFVYNPYEITAYAAGVVEIAVPFSALQPELKPEFVKRFGIK